MTEGLFGMIILYIFEILPILEVHNINVSKWDVSTVSYGEIFPSLLEYNSIGNDTYEVELFSLRNVTPQYTLGDDFERLHQLFFKYLKIPTYLTQIVDNCDLSECIGIHFRGTDKTIDTVMNTPITHEDFYIIIESFIKTNNTKKIFLATDEMEVYKYLKNKYTSIDFITSRNFDTNLFWRNNDITCNGKEAMIDMLSLSKCKMVLKVSSALSAFSKIINPKLPIYRLNASKLFADIPYFPDAYIPLFEKQDNYTQECNDVLDKIQQHDWSKTHKHVFNNFSYKVR